MVSKSASTLPKSGCPLSLYGTEILNWVGPPQGSAIEGGRLSVAPDIIGRYEGVVPEATVIPFCLTV